MSTPRASFTAPGLHSASSWLSDQAPRPSVSSATTNTDGRPRPLEPALNSALPNLSASAHESFGDLPPVSCNRPPASLLEWCYSRDTPWDPIQVKTAPASRAGDARTGSRPFGLHARPSGLAFSGFRASNVPAECDTSPPGVLPSDSGYESRTRQSVGNPSIYGDVDRCQDTQSIASRLADVQFDRLGLPPDTPWTPQGTARGPEPHVVVDDSGLRCNWCRQKVKTKSELNKHRQKHTKPHHCNVPGCLRKEGFSTTNDLDRHKRSCHPQLRSNGNRYRCTYPACRVKDKVWPRADNFRQHLKRVHKLKIEDDDLASYILRESSVDPLLAGLTTSATGNLIIAPNMNHDSSLLPASDWPYFDQRMDPDTVHESATVDSVPNYCSDESSLVSRHFQMMATRARGDGQISQGIAQMSPMELEAEIMASHPNNDNGQVSGEPDLEQQIRSASEVVFIQPNVLSQEPMPTRKPFPDVSSLEPAYTEGDLLNVQMKLDPEDRVQRLLPANQLSASQTEDGSSRDNKLDGEEDAPADAESPPTLISSSNSGSRAFATTGGVVSYKLTTSESAVNDEHMTNKFIKDLEEKGALAKAVERLGYQKSGVSEPSVTATSYVQVPCTYDACSKTFNRRCELKKHMRRHEKPYGCTFSGCTKRFGSKNDWKRHENSQHSQMELWKCNETLLTDPEKLCGKTSYRREQFRVHLSKEHALADAGIDRKLEECRVGGRCEARFWCGFCERTIDIKQKGLKAWTERFDHIGAHYTGRNYARKDISQWREIDPDLPPGIKSESCRCSSEYSTPTSTEAGFGGRRSKRRPADDATLDCLPRKRQRRIHPNETYWFCCQCKNGEILSLSNRCMLCGDHERCDNCEIEINWSTELK